MRPRQPAAGRKAGRHTHPPQQHAHPPRAGRPAAPLPYPALACALKVVSAPGPCVGCGSSRQNVAHMPPAVDSCMMGGLGSQPAQEGRRSTGASSRPARWVPHPSCQPSCGFPKCSGSSTCPSTTSRSHLAGAAGMCMLTGEVGGKEVVPALPPERRRALRPQARLRGHRVAAWNASVLMESRCHVCLLPREHQGRSSNPHAPKPTPKQQPGCPPSPAPRSTRSRRCPASLGAGAIWRAASQGSCAGVRQGRGEAPLIASIVLRCGAPTTAAAGRPAACYCFPLPSRLPADEIGYRRVVLVLKNSHVICGRGRGADSHALPHPRGTFRAAGAPA